MNQTDTITHHAVAVAVHDTAKAHVQKPVAVHDTTHRVSKPTAVRQILPKDTLAKDTLAVDTVHKTHVYGITLTPPKYPKVEVNAADTTGMSWVIGGLLLLFCIIGIRFHNNRRYVATLFQNLVDVRTRMNVFDETVRETSFLVLLNLLWSCSAGILLYGLLCHTTGFAAQYGFNLHALTTHPSLSIAICMGIGVAYTCFMSLAYVIVGNVFADSVKAKMWLKGYTAGQGLLSTIYFILALLMLSHPEWGEILLWIAAGMLILTKIVFIWKGFRIFFTQISSWVLFLCYLCSLEIVPLILTYLAAIFICSLLH